MDYDLNDVLCEVMSAGEDDRDLIMVDGETVQELSSEELMGLLLEREDEFVSCRFSGTRLNLVMGSGEMFVDLW